MPLRRMNRRRVQLERAVRRRIGTLTPVVPADSVPRPRVVVEDLLDYPSPRRPLGRLRLSENAISG
jgi:hypothetical protein